MEEGLVMVERVNGKILDGGKQLIKKTLKIDNSGTDVELKCSRGKLKYAGSFTLPKYLNVQTADNIFLIYPEHLFPAMQKYIFLFV